MRDTTLEGAFTLVLCVFAVVSAEGFWPEQYLGPGFKAAADCVSAFSPLGQFPDSACKRNETAVKNIPQYVWDAYRDKVIVIMGDSNDRLFVQA
jgi:hypothetical protein